MARLWNQSSATESSLDHYVQLYWQQQRLLRTLSATPSPSPVSESAAKISTLATPPASPSSLTPYARPNIPDVDEARELRDVSQLIKCELTTLLNSERSRTDESFRAWVQARLLDAEHKLKKLRRRRNSVSREAANIIGQHFGGNQYF